MPLMDSDDEATWNSLYAIHADNGVVWHFQREAKSRIIGQEHFLLKDALHLQPGQKIALIGAGFGWVAEDWIDAGLNVVATDTSAYVHARKATQARVPIINENSLTPASRVAILAAAGLPPNGKFDWIISEDVLPMLNDGECQGFAAALRSYGKNICHWVSCKNEGNYAPLNWKTKEEWKALMSPDLIVQRGYGEAI